MQIEVHFTKIKQEIIRHINNAHSEIKVAVAWLTDEDIIRTLTQKQKHGVEVEIVISDSKENFRNTRKFHDFLKSKGKLFIAHHKFLHHKFCVIDNSLIINGSYNWTYYAQSNEENIMVISLNVDLEQDSKLLQKFTVKHRFFCNKLSTLITHSTDLNNYTSANNDWALTLSQLDETEIKLRQELENDVKKSFSEAQTINVRHSPRLLERMEADGGGVEFIKRILRDEMASKEMKSGFNKLIDIDNAPHRVDLSLEYLVAQSKYETLFTPEEVKFCRELMAQFNIQ